MAANRDLARLPETRVMPVVHRRDKRPDVIMVGTASELSEATKSAGLQVVGRYTPRPDGRYSVPVVYVSKRATPWYGRRWVHVTAVILGALLALGSAVSLAILHLGLPGFIATIVAAAFVIAGLTRVSRGGGRSVSVSTTTTTKVRVR